MTKRALFIVGAPGVGKTSAVRLGLGADPFTVPKPRWTIGRDGAVWAAGHYLGQTFDGADTVPYNGAREALTFWERKATARLTIFDGDRFSNEAAIAHVEAALGEANVLCVHLTAGGSVLDARRAARGSKQNASWMAGRVTKASNVATRFQSLGRLALALDTSSLGPEEVWARIEEAAGVAGL